MGAGRPIMSREFVFNWVGCQRLFAELDRGTRGGTWPRPLRFSGPGVSLLPGCTHEAAYASARRLSFRFRVFEQRLHSQYDFGGRNLQDFRESDERSDSWTSDAAFHHADVRAVKPAVKG